MVQGNSFAWMQSTLAQRTLTAIALVPLVLAAIFLLSNSIFALIAAIVLLGGAWEWAGLIKLKKVQNKLWFVLATALSIAFVAQLSADTVYLIAFCWWLLASFSVLRYPLGKGVWGHSWVIAIMGLVTLSIAWFALVDLQSTEHGSRLVLFIMCIIWGADTGAYFAGRKWGKTKLAPAVSPGKSIAGLMGGILVTLSFTFVVLFQLELVLQDKIFYLFLTLLTVLASVIGDLFESMLKRFSNVKDSGNLLPGHGGVLDRVDSLTAAVPIFTAGLYFSGAFV